jgi:redox-sensitive bicupin YhaK (pirin superfamily)
MGNAEIIKFGDVQVMSAGTGIRHSEFNPNEDKRTKLLQIWLFPNKRNVEPRYQQITLDVNDRQNKLQQILSPNPEDAGVWIHQDAWFHMGKFEKGITKTYNVKRNENGVYAFVISGSITINGQVLETKDALGITNTEKLEITATSDAEILLMDIPME